MIDFSTATTNQLLIIHMQFKQVYDTIQDYSDPGTVPYYSEIIGIYGAVENELFERGIY